MSKFSLENRETSWIRRTLLAWYDENALALPWRTNPEPYRTWVSEIMLQQTQIKTVIPYYERFLKRFPHVQGLASAPEDDVLKAWEGLGYYSRARNLQKAAKMVVNDLGGVFPGTAEALQDLPGIGRYTAGAIASICYGENAPLLDGNVKRVLARYLAEERPVEESAVLKAMWALCETLVPKKRPGDFNQAVMELGERVCGKTPQCDVCPLNAKCRGYAQGLAANLPTRKPKKKVPHRTMVAGLIKRGGTYLIGRRPTTAMLGGLWEFPGAELDKPTGPKIATVLKDLTGLTIKPGRKKGTVEHAYSHFTIDLSGYPCTASKGKARSEFYTEFAWVTPDAFGEYSFPGANHKLIKACFTP